MNELSESEVASLKELLEEAFTIVSKGRNESYGHPIVNHTRTAGLFAAYMMGKKPSDIDAEDVCMLNVLQKISRHAHSRGRDNLVDIIGWATNAHTVGDYQDVSRPHS